MVEVPYKPFCITLLSELHGSCHGPYNFRELLIIKRQWICCHLPNIHTVRNKFKTSHLTWFTNFLSIDQLTSFYVRSLSFSSRLYLRLYHTQHSRLDSRTSYQVPDSLFIPSLDTGLGLSLHSHNNLGTPSFKSLPGESKVSCFCCLSYRTHP